MQAVSHLEQQPAWGTFASLLVHACLLLLVLALPALRQHLEPAEQEVVVTLVPPLRPLPPVTEPEPALPPPRATAGPRQADTPRPAPGMIRATSMLSEKTLADARSSEARQILRLLSRDERTVQLCNLEAMDQIRSWRRQFRPERLVAYAKAELRFSGNSLEADGAAFRSRKKWYDLRFKCQVSSDSARVVAFEFLVGDPIPAEEWETLSLPSVH